MSYARLVYGLHIAFLLDRVVQQRESDARDYAMLQSGRLGTEAVNTVRIAEMQLCRHDFYDEGCEDCGGERSQRPNRSMRDALRAEYEERY